MARAEWTYEVAPAGAPSAGLDEYVVESASGARVGKVQTLLRRGDELLLAFDRGNPPLTHDVRVVPWGDVADVDHTALSVRLRLDDPGVDEALELDPDKGVENGDADAVRVTELPPDLRQPSVPGEETGPVDRPTYVLALALGAAGLLAALIVVMATAGIDGDWKFALFAIPVVVLAAAGLAAYRAFREPYERR